MPHEPSFVHGSNNEKETVPHKEYRPFSVAFQQINWNTLQVTKETGHMREQGVLFPIFPNTWEQGYIEEPKLC